MYFFISLDSQHASNDLAHRKSSLFLLEKGRSIKIKINNQTSLRLLLLFFVDAVGTGRYSKAIVAVNTARHHASYPHEIVLVLQWEASPIIIHYPYQYHQAFILRL